ncbi:MAG: Holliday junction resolvase RuvX [Bryobacteraceae bacterium]|nr:Holliday junction resolvase RuvX [Bryobacteraceae bacterium]
MTEAASTTPARTLALDLGMRRIGLAISDALGMTAQGLETFQRTTLREDVARLGHFIREYEVGAIVIGNPLHMSGRDSRQGGYVKDFAGRLAERTGLPVILWDERLTTVQATRVLRESGISQKKRGQAVDRLSAVLILQSYLDSLPGAAEWPDASE